MHSEEPIYQDTQIICILMKVKAAADGADSVMSVMFTADQDVKTFENMKSAEIKT